MITRLPDVTLTGLEVSDLFFNSVKDWQDYKDLTVQAYDFLNNLPSLKARITVHQLVRDFANRL